MKKFSVLLLILGTLSLMAWCLRETWNLSSCGRPGRSAGCTFLRSGRAQNA